MPFSSMFSVTRTTLYLVFFCTLSNFIYAEEPVHPDVRIVVDISGSMKKNDPNNLRIPAVNMLLGLLPDNATAGVWTFGRYVNMLVPHKPVNDSWRAEARKNIPEINSVAQYTNIELALKKAGYDLVEGKTQNNTHLILLTDGQVDISKDDKKNAQSRKNIKWELVKKYRDAGVKIHTIALSEQADHNLLNKIALATGGVSTVAADAEQLMGTFLQVLDQAAPQDQLPIMGNVFQIDSSVEEATILLFRKSSEQSTRLTDPKGKAWKSNQLSNSMKWYEDEKYDLITITKPMRGDWVIGSTEHPDNRVSVISDLKMRVEGLPTVIMPGDPLNMDVFFLEKERLLDDPQFLDLIDITIQIDRNGVRLGAAKVTDFPLVNGKYQVKLRSLSKYASYAILIEADGKTFSRKFQRVFKIAPPPPKEPDDVFVQPPSETQNNPIPELMEEPISIAINSVGTAENPEYEIQMDIKDPTLNTSSAKVVSMIVNPIGTTLFGAAETISDKKWVLKIESEGLVSPGDYDIKFAFSGKRQDGDKFVYNPEGLVISHPDDWVNPDLKIADEIVESDPAEFDLAKVEDDDPVEGVEEILIDTIEEEPLIEDLPEAATDDSDLAPQSAWYENAWMIGGLIVFFNLLVIGGGFFAYRKFSTDDTLPQELAPVPEKTEGDPKEVLKEKTPDPVPDDEALESTDPEEADELQDLLDAVGEELVSEDPAPEESPIEPIEADVTTTPPQEAAPPAEQKVEEEPKTEEKAEEKEPEAPDDSQQLDQAGGGVDDLEDIDALMAEFSAIDEDDSEPEPEPVEEHTEQVDEEGSEKTTAKESVDSAMEAPAPEEDKESSDEQESDDEFEIVGFDEDLSDDPK